MQPTRHSSPQVRTSESKSKASKRPFAGGETGMPPNPAAQATTPTLLLDKENAHSARSTSLAKAPLTEPPKRKPLQTKDTNRQTPTENASAARGKSASEPSHLAKKTTLPIQIIDASETGAPVRARKRPCLSSREEGVPAKPSSEWKFGSGQDSVQAIASKLKLTSLPPNAESPLLLFQHLEQGGLLCPSTLRLFARCPGIHTLMMAASYGGGENEAGMHVTGSFPVEKCTQPLFSGYLELRVLDLTCVAVQDEELRYLIKLRQLQGLGLSGTKITSRGIRYLAKHAQFAGTLRCIKLCYVEGLDDAGVRELAAFSSLAELDVYGSNRVSLNALLDLIPSKIHKSTLKRLRPPERVGGVLRDRHAVYTEMARAKGDVESDPRRVEHMSLEQVRVQLRYHQKHYPDTFLNLAIDSLQKKLWEILVKRQREELLWSIAEL